jgi:hypothetical protein
VRASDPYAIEQAEAGTRTEAYTIVMMELMFHLTVMSQFVTLLPRYSPRAVLPPLNRTGEIGVGGSPDAENEEIRAKAGVAKVQNSLPRWAQADAALAIEPAARPFPAQVRRISRGLIRST